jgi:hypothetical protein
MNVFHSYDIYPERYIAVIENDRKRTKFPKALTL